MAKNKATYTAAEVRVFQDLMFRQHQQELADRRATGYTEGYRAGDRAARNEFRLPLGLDPLRDVE